jgi:hypothetical protein
MASPTGRSYSKSLFWSATQFNAIGGQSYVGNTTDTAPVLLPPTPSYCHSNDSQAVGAGRLTGGSPVGRSRISCSWGLITYLPPSAGFSQAGFRQAGFSQAGFSQAGTNVGKQHYFKPQACGEPPRARPAAAQLHSHLKQAVAPLAPLPPPAPLPALLHRAGGGNSKGILPTGTAFALTARGDALAFASTSSVK